jgi:hypothetical protein
MTRISKFTPEDSRLAMAAVSQLIMQIMSCWQDKEEVTDTYILEQFRKDLGVKELPPGSVTTFTSLEDPKRKWLGEHTDDELFAMMCAMSRLMQLCAKEFKMRGHEIKYDDEGIPSFA